MVVLKYLLTAEDHYKFNYYRFWISPSSKKARIKYYLKFIVFVLIGGYIIHILSGNTFTKVDAGIYFLVSLIGVLLSPAIESINIKRQINKLLADPKNISYITPTELLISEKGIIDKNKFSESKYEWESIVRKEETKEYYFLHLTTLLVLSIPKRAFASEAERKEFDLYLSKYISLQTEFDGHLTKQIYKSR